MTREEAIEVIKIAQAQIEWEYPMDYSVAFDIAINALKVPERKHAQWIWHEDTEEFECSCCRDIFDYTHTYDLFDHGFQQANYCPNCGAIMDEEG